MSKKKYNQVLIDASSEAHLLNRYLAHCKWQRYDQEHGLRGNKKIIEKREWLQIQWKNIKYDLIGLFTNPYSFIPKIAFSLAAFWFIFQHKYSHAISLAFMGDVAFDAGTGSGTNGDQTAVTWSHTVTGTNTAIVISTECLNGTTSAKYNTASLTNCIAASTPSTHEQSFYAAGVATGSHTAEVDSTSASPLCGAAVSMTSVAQSNTIGATSSATSGTSSALTTGTDGSMRIDIACIDNETASTPSATLSSGTKRATGTGGSNQFNEYTTIYTNPQPTAGAHTYTWTFANNNRDAYMAIEFKPVAAGAQYYSPLATLGVG